MIYARPVEIAYFAWAGSVSLHDLRRSVIHPHDRLPILESGLLKFNSYKLAASQHRAWKRFLVPED